MVINVVLVDDDPLVRAGLRMIIESDAVKVVGEAADGEEALTLIRQKQPDLVMLDIRMPRMNGIAVTTELRAAGDPVRILILTTFVADELVLSALRGGADGFLLKDTPPSEIVSAIHRTVRGEAVLSPAATATLVNAVIERPDADMENARKALAGLSQREHRVAIAVARGQSNQQIAEELHISVTTVKTHITALFTKLSAGSRVDIARAVFAARAL